MGTYKGWVDYYYNQPVTNYTFTGTMTVPALDEDGVFGPCQPDVMLDADETVGITMTYGSGREHTGEFILQVPDEPDEVELENYILSVPTDKSTAVARCSYKDIERIDPTPQNDDLFLLNTYKVDYWEKEYAFDEPIAKYASGVWGDWIYIFGGCRDTGWEGINDFIRYNVKTKQVQTLNNGGLSPRADCYGWCEDGYFFVYGGYTHSLTTQEFQNDFWKYNTETGVWTQLSIPMERVTNKLVGGHGRLFIGNAMSASSTGQGWNWLASCYEYDIATDTWSAPYNGNDYQPEKYYNFETFIFHKGTLYYYNEGRLMQILPDQFETTVGVPFPNYNPKMASYKDYIIFSHGTSDADNDGNVTPYYETKWYNTVDRTYGTFGTDGELPNVVYGFDIWVIDGTLYMIGGIPDDDEKHDVPNNVSSYTGFGNIVWSINLEQFFGDDMCPPKMPPDTYREKVVKMCSPTNFDPVYGCQK